MAADETGAEMSKAAFAGAFSMLRPAILDEWSELDATALATTDGEFDKVVALLAERTNRTKALIRRQLAELYAVVVAEPRDSAAPRRAPSARSQSTGDKEKAATPRMDDLLAELEQRTAQIVRELRGGFLNDTRNRVKENVFFSLLVAVGFGFILGVLFTGSNRGK